MSRLCLPGKASLFLLIVTASAADKSHRRPNREGTAPTIFVAPDDQTALVGEKLVLRCEAAGSPKPRIVWERNGRKVRRNRFDITHYNLKNGSASVLWMEEVKKSRKADELAFTCVATNQQGRDARTVTIQVAKSRPSGSPSIIVSPAKLKLVEMGNDVTLVCEGDGVPKPYIFWYKDQMKLDVEGDERIMVTPTGMINIRATKKSDEGKYHCVAENIHGNVVSHSSTLHVRVRRVAPKFLMTPYKLYDVPIGEGVNITCVAVGAPMPNVKWQRETEGGPVPVIPANGPSNATGRLVLQLKNVRESANYTCVAISIINTIKFTTSVRVRSYPQPPAASDQAGIPTTTAAMIAPS